MITVSEEMSWHDIYESAWSGARYTAERLQEEGKGDEFMGLIEELYPDGIGRTALNDLMWFDSDWIYESLGMTAEE